MVHAFTNNITRIIGLFLVAFVSALVLPISVMAEPETLPCTDARLQIEQTHILLRPLQQRQQQLQQDVRATYQQLFACKAGTTLSIAQQQYCSHLQEEGPKQFQTMIEVITLSHQTSQQLAHQTRHVQLICPTISEHTYPEIISLTPSAKNWHE